MDKVSVIIPCYNGERTIKRCFDSIQKQTYQNYEIIFVNDGSTDRTLEIVKEYASKNARIKVIDTLKNQGVSAARNVGILHATGNYIQFMDADDEMMPDMMETLLRAVKENDAQIAVCNFSGNPMFYTEMEDKVYDLYNENQMLEYYQNTFCMLLVWNKLYRREILVNRFDESVHFAEDELFNLEVLQKVRRIACINKKLYIYHYAPAEEHMEKLNELSCMNKIVDATNMESRNSIWYMGKKLVPKRKAILEELQKVGLITNVNDYLYTRVFDFYFWELSTFLYMKVDKRMIIRETLQVFQEKEFIKSLSVQEKYGIHYLKKENEELETFVESYIDLCVDIYSRIRNENYGCNAYTISVLLFLELFCTEGKCRCRDYNQLCQLIRDEKENSTKEVRFIRQYTNSLRLKSQRQLVCEQVG